MHYSDQLRVKVDKEARMVSLSVRIDENNVWTRKVPLADFQMMVASFNAQMESNNNPLQEIFQPLIGKIEE